MNSVLIYNEAKRRFYESDPVWVECSEKFYNSMLCAVPPEFAFHTKNHGYMFACGEIWNHVDGEPIYAVFRSKPVRAVKMMSPAQTLNELSHGHATTSIATEDSPTESTGEASKP